MLHRGRARGRRALLIGGGGGATLPAFLRRRIAGARRLMRFFLLNLLVVGDVSWIGHLHSYTGSARPARAGRGKASDQRGTSEATNRGAAHRFGGQRPPLQVTRHLSHVTFFCRCALVASTFSWRKDAQDECKERKIARQGRCLARSVEALEMDLDFARGLASRPGDGGRSGAIHRSAID